MKIIMKQVILRKIFATSVICMSLGASVSVCASELNSQSYVATNHLSKNVQDQSVIKNGDFHAGLDYWIVSNPNTNNPALITENSKRYVKASNGENIHQFVALKPNTKYHFSYEVASGDGFPAKVEFGTLNQGEAFKMLQENTHSNNVWEKHEFTFTTPETENTYIIRFSSTGSGWATFRNIDIQSAEVPIEDTLLHVGVENNQAYIYLNLTKEQFNSKERFIVYLDGKYYFETYAGTAYYSSTEKIDEDSVKAYRDFKGKKGEKIEVYRVSGIPGESAENKQLIESLVVDQDLMTTNDKLTDAVKDIQVIGKKAIVTLDQQMFEQKNRLVISKNGSYLAETYAGTAYYASAKKENGVVQLTYDTSLLPGNILSVQLVGGKPGDVIYSNSFSQVLSTFEVK